MARAFGLPLLFDVAGQAHVMDMLAPQFPDLNFIVPHLGSFADDWRVHQQVVDQLVRFPNVYGIDMPTRSELIATGRNDEEIAREIGADAVVYQDMDALKAAVRAVNPKLTQFEASCFDGVYVTGDITSEYLASVERTRHAGRQESQDENEQGQLDLEFKE